MEVVRGGFVGGALVLGAVLLAGCSGQAQPTTAEPAPAAEPDKQQDQPTESAQSQSPVGGSYIDYATYAADPQAYAASDVVLFFNASWCPTCQAAQKSFTTMPVPSGLTLVSVDYDDSTDLRKEYGVTVQHTFVQVDPAGGALAKWTGSSTAEQVAARTV